MGDMARAFLVWLWRGLVLVVLTVSLAASGVPMVEASQRVQRYTRAYEFEFLNWTADALAIKFSQYTLRTSDHLAPEARTSLVLEYFDLAREASTLEAQVNEIFGDPAVEDPEVEAQSTQGKLSGVQRHQSQIQATAESVLAEQVSATLADAGLNFAGEVLPPVAFHFSPTPLAIIASPRDVIRQEANVDLNPGLSVEEQITLEGQVERGTGLSALVVPIGGLGTYPTMIQETSAVSWVVETIVHEWVHNYLAFHPLGLNYSTSPELRTMNETVASLLGRELGRMALARYYPAYLPPPPSESEESQQGEQPTFDFRAEMRETRVTVDRLLALGEIAEAESYMQARRQMFWEHGYHIRKLNQAYFAFYGAYADEPGGAAGEDPVGAAVRSLWDRLQNPRQFLRTMASMDKFSDLQEALRR
jgi:hypothetical protein